MGTPSQFWLLRLGAQVFALEPHAFKEVLEVDRPAPVPLSPPFVLGLLASSGNILPLVDLGELLGQELGKPTLAAVVGQPGPTLAIAIHEVLRLYTPLEEMTPNPLPAEHTSPWWGQPFVTGWISWEDQPIPVLGLEALTAMLTEQTRATLGARS
ncbi:MAG: chemotaxis protein CheW [Thermaceae bacterium]|nr:chemotaxis protein CheW [Thermaceae bacterium]